MPMGYSIKKCIVPDDCDSNPKKANLQWFSIAVREWSDYNQ
jgi:hypothetical protein